VELYKTYIGKTDYDNLTAEIIKARALFAKSEDPEEIKKTADKLQKDSLKAFEAVYRQQAAQNQQNQQKK